jgi:HAD superfamily hydrolase (TIGR01450 family)
LKLEELSVLANLLFGAEAISRVQRNTPAPPPIIGPADRLIVDLDGTLVRGGLLTPGAAAFLDMFDGRFAVVSNNSTDTALRLSAVLGRLGLSVAPGQLVLAGEEMIRFAVANFPDARCLCVTTGLLRRQALRLGLRLVQEDPDIVLLGRDRTITYDKIALIVNAVRRGAKLVVANPDLSHPALDGDVVPETGVLMNAIVAGSGIEPHFIIGKPEAGLFRTALERLASSAAATVVIGDNPDTDGVGAMRLGMRCIMIGAVPSAHAPSLAAYLRMTAQ